jgi:hypothetical protein
LLFYSDRVSNPVRVKLLFSNKSNPIEFENFVKGLKNKTNFRITLTGFETQAGWNS